MKHVDLFNDFLKDTVNLNDTRVKELEISTEAIKDAIRASDWTPHISGWMEQGSWAHKTIIKPVDQGEFDADLIVFVSPVDGWDAAKYTDTLLDALKSNGTYKDKVKRWSHCVTVTYANDKKVDVAPCVVNRGGLTRLDVCNHDSNQFERTEPRLYTDWLVQRNAYSGSNSFRKVTRLIKYLRDIKTRFTCSSVLLTTILGYRIGPADEGSDAFADTPTALKTIFGRMDDWLQLNLTKPAVTNPYLNYENFSTDWTDEQYANFRGKIHTYREWIDDAFDEEDRSESIAKWRRIFGEDFASGVVINEGKSAGQLVVADMRRTLAEASQFGGDLVEAIKRFGERILPASFNRRPYMEAPPWKKAPANQQVGVTVRAILHRNNLGTQPVREVLQLEPLQPSHWLLFKATTNTGLPFGSGEYRVMWRVTNTDEAAASDNALRGKLEKPESDNSRWESLKYRGVHLVEAFVIRKRDDRIIGKSEAFRVMIE
ncbi:nucleotidyltransferase [Bradyrhizobium sp. 146]|uniref:SMODS domain-containing nucleotidyltransferase n=1 Tax=Bradyrhizobium sp. 146 TaxID=2782622 RepID=UPI001FF73C99|nr:nucleotidyltransferase [Bradyrhizobium sp. 146]MCK1702602.1 nucleotidyltransferase [Bradyrhizobium sp. 146]